MNSNVHFFVQTLVPQAVSYFPSNFAPLGKTIPLRGYSHFTVDAILTGVCRRASKAQIIHHCLDNTVQGVILPDRSVGIYGVDGYVSVFLEEARAAYQRARAVHDAQEKIYITNMDFAAADRLTEETVHALFDGKMSQNSGSRIDRFLGAATINGGVNYIPEITQDIPKRYLIQGRPGTGKSTLLKRIAREAIARGFHAELYHCSLDPNSLDLVAVRELGFCLFDSTAPHAYFPTRAGDAVIDIYQKCVTPGTDETYREELAALQSTYKEMLSHGAACLQKVKEDYDRYEASLPGLSEAEVEALAEKLLTY